MLTPQQATDAAAQCESCIDKEPSRRCSLGVMGKGPYCKYHAPFPNLGVVLSQYASATKEEDLTAMAVESFVQQHYQTSRLPPGSLVNLAKFLKAKEQS